MRVPTALAALTLSAALLLALPTTASAHVVPQLQTAVVEPAPGPMQPDAPITDPPVTAVPPSNPAPVAPVPVPSDVPAPVPAPDPSPAPSGPAPAPVPVPAATSSPPAAPSPVPSATEPEPDGETTTPAVEENEAVLRDVGRAEGVPAPAVVPRTARTPLTSTTPAPRTAVPSASATTTEAAVVPGMDDGEASSPLASAEPAARYVAAGVLSIIAVVLALAIAVVAQPRRPRHTH